ncbi:MAG: hypothetical protein HOP02_00720 [Methylococcaceae bacterium]|nr:hypothetical protein [Methylococcaceae bacterium]
MSLLLNAPVKTFLFFALACEAKPYVAHFGFKKSIGQTVFEIYQTHNMILTITGVGKSAMAAGVAYSLALFKNEQVAVIINVGIAGHKTAALGQLWIAEKITDADSAKRYYPQCLPKTTLASAPLVTVSQPQTVYAPDTLYDMEASAFYETATRFTSSELVLIAKVISDNQQSAVHNINAKQVSALLSQHLAAIAALLEQFNSRAQALTTRSIEAVEQISNALHFTVSEKNQLIKLLSRWHVLSSNAPLPLSAAALKSARMFLDELSALILQLPVAL